MAIETVAVTGGNGTLGRATIAALADAGYRTANLNRGKRAEAVADAYRRTDLLDAGEVYGSLAACDADAVVHLGMVPTPERTPGHVTFESNAQSSYHVLEAAAGLGVETVVLASSMSAMGAGFEPKPVEPTYLPVDEAHPDAPTTSYGLGKRALEVAAAGFGRRAGPPRTVTAIRYPWVATPADVEETLRGGDRTLDGLRDAGAYHTARNTLFAYLPADDAARVTRLAVEADHRGHETVWVAAADTTVETPTAEVVAEAYPAAERRRSFEGRASLVDTGKARALLGWTPERSWTEG